MPKHLTDAQISEYRECGFLSPVDVMSESEAAGILAELEEIELSCAQHLAGKNRNNPHLVFTCFDALAFNKIVLDVVEDLLGPDIALWGSVLFIKEPQSSQFVTWHQDATYMGMASNDFVTPWIALSPSNVDTGCMAMIPGSHLQNIKPHDDTYGEDNILTRGQVVRDVDESSAVDLILKPGQMSLHHAQTVHGSKPNTSQQRRVGFALQSFMPSNVRQTIGQNFWLPARGLPPVGDGVTFLSRPTGNLGEKAIAERQMANSNFDDILYHGASQRRDF